VHLVPVHDPVSIRTATGSASGSAVSADVQATFCATLVDQWVLDGLAHAVVAPGSRSTPMALALANRPGVELHVFHDERSASFAALGIGLVTNSPAVLLCTSGTAAAHFHAAVAEADLSCVPMMVLTADRPPELLGVGAPQTIDQTRLYGSAVRWFHDPGVASLDNLMALSCPSGLGGHGGRSSGTGPSQPAVS
jgi:2-succinyl-5-enolpyruvyl-6-hydroxy-3-cyclohexene-1-carboxylate synthase